MINMLSQMLNRIQSMSSVILSMRIALLLNYPMIVKHHILQIRFLVHMIIYYDIFAMSAILIALVIALFVWIYCLPSC